MPRQPNILLIHSDQHRYDCVGANGAQLVRTPTIDRLAREGVTFSHAFTPCPVCSPARASLLTGTWATTHGCMCIPNTELYRSAQAQLPTWTALFKQAGYWLGHVGRFHGEVTGALTDHGVDDYIGTWPYAEWRKQQGLPPQTKTRGLFGAIDRDCPPEKSSLAWQADQVVRMLETAVSGGAPFVVRWDPLEPHLPCHPIKSYADLYAPSSIPPWPSWPDPLEHKPLPQRRQWRMWGIRDWTWQQWQEIVSYYFAVITELDHHIGRVIAALERHGLLDDTLVIYTTDHGDFCGGHGLIDKHFSMYDDIVRVPLVLRWPAGIAPNSVCDAFVTHELDIARTLLDAAGIAAPDSFMGMNLLDLAAQRVPHRTDIFSQYFGTESGMYSVRMVRDRDFKYVYNPTAFDELYDLRNDPGEIHNRIDDPGLKDELARLKQRLSAWMSSVRDPLDNFWIKTDLLGAPNRAQAAGLAPLP